MRTKQLKHKKIMLKIHFHTHFENRNNNNLNLNTKLKFCCFINEQLQGFFSTTKINVKFENCWTRIKARSMSFGQLVCEALCQLYIIDSLNF